MLDVLLMKLSPSMAKLMLKLWLKDEQALSDVAGDLPSLLQGKADDLGTEIAIKRQLDSIAERVLERLIRVFEMDGLSFSDEEKRVVVERAATTFNSVPLTTDVIIANQVDPRKLEDEFIRRLDARGLSSKQDLLLRRVIQNACQIIVDVVSNFPEFKARALSRLIRSQSQLSQAAEEILREIDSLRESIGSSSADGAEGEYEYDYLREVVRKLDVLYLFGADLSKATQRNKLSVAYVSLTAKLDSNGAEETELGIDKVLGSSQKILIRGLAGSGKTTLLQWVAVNAASKRFEAPLQEWNQCIPFFLRLRQLDLDHLPSPEEWPRLLSSTLDGGKPKDWVTEALKNGRAIVLIDGVDEVAEDARPSVREWINELVERFSDCKFLVTSRPVAVREDWLGAEGFSPVSLQPMEVNEIRRFVAHWHTAIQEQAESSTERQEVGQLEQNLQYKIVASASLRALASTPLLCALICALHRERKEEIPKDRIDLYDACIRMLLDRRDAERKVFAEGYSALTFRQKSLVLEDLAYWLVRNREVMIDKPEFQARVEKLLPTFVNVQRVNTPHLVRAFLERSGVLREPVANSIDFAHKTFQEYFAAKAALDDGDVGALLASAHDDQFREVVVLAAGLGSKAQRQQIISGLIELGDKSPAARQRLHLLAVACLETAAELPERLSREVETRLVSLIPPGNMTDAKELSSAGSLATHYLNWQHGFSAIEAAAAVRTLCLIGSQEAFAVLEQYANDSRQTVIKELLRGWDVFDQQEYGRRVASKLRVKTAVLKNRTLVALAHLRHARGLVLERCYVDGARQIGELKQLKTVAIGDCRGEIWAEELGSLNLNQLSVWASELKGDLQALKRLSSLTKLGLGHCRSGTYGYVPELIGLKTLYLWRPEEEGTLDVSYFFNMPKLESVILGGLARLNGGVGVAKSVTTVELRDIAHVPRNILESFPNATTINASSQHGLDYSSIAGRQFRRLALSVEGAGGLKHVSEVKGAVGLELALGFDAESRQILDAIPSVQELNLRGDLRNIDLLALGGRKDISRLVLRGTVNVEEVAGLVRQKADSNEVFQLYVDMEPFHGAFLHDLGKEGFTARYSGHIGAWRIIWEGGLTGAER